MPDYLQFGTILLGNRVEERERAKNRERDKKRHRFLAAITYNFVNEKGKGRRWEGQLRQTGVWRYKGRIKQWLSKL